MSVQVFPSIFCGELRAPSSKSFMQRALAAAFLSRGQSLISFHSLCEDSEAVLTMIQELGAKVICQSGQVAITGIKDFNFAKAQVSCGESGLAMRMMSPIVAHCSREIVIAGKGSLLKRPVTMIEEALNQLGVRCIANNHLLPLRITGPLSGGKIKVDGSLSSQLLTGLLMALPLAQADSQLEVIDLKSKPYIDMTIQLLKNFGIHIINENYSSFTVKGQQHYQACEYEVEGDWSGAAFICVAGALSGPLRIKGLNLLSSQSDRAILNVLEKSGVRVNREADFLRIEMGELKPIHFDATECPDLFPPIVALTSFAAGQSVITGVKRLTYKESDRAMALQSEFSKLGVKIEVDSNEMIIHGRSGQSDTGRLIKVNSHNDHRIAMALTVAAAHGGIPIEIDNAHCVAKSYPDFFTDFKKIGLKVNH